MTHIINYIEDHAALFTALGGIAAVIGTVVGFLLRLRRKKSEYAAQIKDLQDQLMAKIHDAAILEKSVAQLTIDLSKEESENERLRKEFEESKAESAIKIAELNATIETLHERLDNRERAIEREKNLVSKMMKLEGQLWEKRAMASKPRFRPLQDRQAAVISMLNLKGGVGKTTLTAHLGAAFAAKGYRVLLVDFDLQGTLSSLFINFSDIFKKYEDKRLLQHFLNYTAKERRVNLLGYIHPILVEEASGIVPTSDKLAYAEMNLTMSWLLRLGKKDTRFLLRKALHQKRITTRYDVVLIDCPPLINTCCVNALAASDYVLIPVNPSIKVAERVPLLLKTVKNMAAHVNHDLQVAGVVMNRCHSADSLTSKEQAIWNQLMTYGQDQLGLPLHGFKTLIPQTAQIRDAEAGEFRAPERGSDLYKMFRKLAQEIEQRLPADCRRLVTAER